MSQAEVAKRIGKHQSYFSKLESCEKRLDLIEAAAICKIFSVTLDVPTEFVTAIEMLSLCTSMPIYLVLVIKGVPFWRG
jgi:transcriptional regulator with XRE-family HTH domain